MLLSSCPVAGDRETGLAHSTFSSTSGLWLYITICLLGGVLEGRAVGFRRTASNEVDLRPQRCGNAVDRQSVLRPSTILISRVALLDRLKHGFLELLQRHVVGIANCLQFLVQVIEGLYRSLVWDLAKRPRHFRQDRPAPL